MDEHCPGKERRTQSGFLTVAKLEDRLEEAGQLQKAQRMRRK